MTNEVKSQLVDIRVIINTIITRGFLPSGYTKEQVVSAISFGLKIHELLACESIPERMAFGHGLAAEYDLNFDFSINTKHFRPLSPDSISMVFDGKFEGDSKVTTVYSSTYSSFKDSAFMESHRWLNEVMIEKLGYEIFESVKGTKYFGVVNDHGVVRDLILLNKTSYRSDIVFVLQSESNPHINITTTINEWSTPYTVHSNKVFVSETRYYEYKLKQAEERVQWVKGKLKGIKNDSK